MTPIMLHAAQIRHMVKPRVVTAAQNNLNDITAKLEKLTPKQTTERYLLGLSRQNALDVLERAKADAEYTGWRTETLYIGHEQSVRLVSPDGTSYVRTTHGNERVDIILTSKLGDTSTWKLEAEASSTRKARKAERLVKRGEKAAAAKRAAAKQQQEGT